MDNIRKLKDRVSRLKGLSHQFESAKIGMVEKSKKIGDELLSVFRIFHSSFDF
jgi:hypothetical protein